MPEPFFNESAKLEILQILAGAAEYTAHEHAIREALRARGLSVSADYLRATLAWLDEQGAITLCGEGVQVATLTLRGEDVARGSTRLPGVARPVPGRG